MRAIIPDEIGINATVNDVVGFGFNGSLKAVILTRGKDAGSFSLLASGTARVGFDIGGSVTEERGWFYGDARNATRDGLLGTGQDLSLGVGPITGGLWRSLDANGNTTWFGTEGGIGVKNPFLVGGSIGQGVTVPVVTINSNGISFLK